MLLKCQNIRQTLVMVFKSSLDSQIVHAVQYGQWQISVSSTIYMRYYVYFYIYMSILG